MKELVEAHRYELDNFDNSTGTPQVIQFIHKEKVYSVDDFNKLWNSVYDKPSFAAKEIKDGDFITVQNGTTNEEVLSVVINRIIKINKVVPCRENSIAITKLEEALMWLNKRTEGREARGVYGTRTP